MGIEGQQCSLISVLLCTEAITCCSVVPFSFISKSSNAFFKWKRKWSGKQLRKQHVNNYRNFTYTLRSCKQSFCCGLLSLHTDSGQCGWPLGRSLQEKNVLHIKHNLVLVCCHICLLLPPLKWTTSIFLRKLADNPDEVWSVLVWVFFLWPSAVLCSPV